MLLNNQFGLSCSLLLRPKSLVPYDHFHTPCYIMSAGRDYELFLLPNWAWESSTYWRNVFDAMANFKANSIAFFSRFCK